VAVRTNAHEIEQFAGDGSGKAEALACQHSAHMIGAALVELVDLAQHQRLAFRIRNTETFEETAHDPAIVDVDRERTDRQIGEHREDHRRQLGVETDRQVVLADHVDVGLVELAEAPALRAFATIHALDLVATEREREVVFVLGDVARQRYGQVEAQREFWHTLT
jgi:hypothetical protein